MSELTSPPLQVIDTPIMLFDGATVSKATAGAAAAVLLMPNGKRYTVSQFLSKASEQEAKYQGLIIGLEKAQKLGIQQLEIKGDSKVIFRQIKGLTTIKDKQILRLYKQALKLLRQFEKASFELIPSEQNRSANTAVNRCIAEALGRETQGGTSRPQSGTTTAQMISNVARLIKLGSKATDEDYQDLTSEKDDFTAKSLSQLMELVSNNIRDEIALYWDGQDEHLAEIYRWYLRGLSPDMAIHKVQIDTQAEKPEEEKLPWEGELLFRSELENENFEFENPFDADSSTSLETTESSMSVFSLVEEIDENDDLFQDSVNLPQKIADSFLATIAEDYSKDTLPSDAKVMHIIELICTLSLEEKTLLVEELVKTPDIVNLMLKAIAEQMTGGQS